MDNHARRPLYGMLGHPWRPLRGLGICGKRCRKIHRARPANSDCALAQLKKSRAWDFVGFAIYIQGPFAVGVVLKPAACGLRPHFTLRVIHHPWFSSG